MVFATLALLQIGNALAIRSETDSLFRLGLRSNLPLTLAVAATFVVQMALIFVPALQPIFGTVALTLPQLALVLVASTLGFAAVEVEKWVGRRTSWPHVGRAAASVARRSRDPSGASHDRVTVPQVDIPAVAGTGSREVGVTIRRLRRFAARSGQRLPSAEARFAPRFREAIGRGHAGSASRSR